MQTKFSDPVVPVEQAKALHREYGIIGLDGTPFRSRPTKAHRQFLEVESRRELDFLHAEYREDLTRYDSTEQKQSEHYSKSMLAVATASLAFSISIGQWKKPPFENQESLIGSWGCFILTALFTVYSFRRSQMAFQCAKDFARAKYDFKSAECKEKLRAGSSKTAVQDCTAEQEKMAEAETMLDIHNSRIQQLNDAAMFAFFAGLALLLLFSATNLS